MSAPEVTPEQIPAALLAAMTADEQAGAIAFYGRALTELTPHQLALFTLLRRSLGAPPKVST